MVASSKLKKHIKDDLRNILNCLDDHFAFFSALSEQHIFCAYDCKEEFCYDFDNEARILFSGLSIENTSNQNIKYVESFKAQLEQIEELLEIPKNQRTSIKVVRFDYPKLYEGDDYSYVGFYVNQKSSFWFNSPIKIELFCCLFKTLIGLQKQNFTSKKVLYDFLLKQGDYFNNSLIWALDNCKTAARVLGLQSYDQERKFLYNFKCNGIVSALGEYVS